VTTPPEPPPEEAPDEEPDAAPDPGAEREGDPEHSLELLRAVEGAVEEAVEEVVGEIVDPDDVRRVAREVVHERIEMIIEATSGFFPPPGMVERYERSYPGFLSEMVGEFKAEGAHRRKQERRSLTAQISITLLGQVFAFTIAIAGLGFGAYLINAGRSISGYAILVTAVGGIVGSFLYFKSRDGQNSRTESEEPGEPEDSAEPSRPADRPPAQRND
jgi:uncharacterized membrane protein